MKKTLCLISVLMAMVLLLTACGGGGSGSVEGTWALTDAKGEGIGDEFTQGMQLIKSMGGSVVMKLNGGKLTISLSFMGQEQSEESTYKINGNKLEIDGSAIDYSVNGNTLTLSADGVSLIFNRQ